MQPSNLAEAKDPRRVLPESLSRRPPIQHHRDRLADVLRTLRQGDGSGHHVRPGEEEVPRLRVPFVRRRRLGGSRHDRALHHPQRQAGGDQKGGAARRLVQPQDESGSESVGRLALGTARTRRNDARTERSDERAADEHDGLDGAEYDGRVPRMGCIGRPAAELRLRQSKSRLQPGMGPPAAAAARSAAAPVGQLQRDPADTAIWILR